MKKFIIFLLLSIQINSNCQNIDDVFAKFKQIQNQTKHRLFNYRSYRYRPLQDFSSDLPFSLGLTLLDNPTYNGVDLSARGVLADSTMQMRVLQLLNNEFYDGEFEDLWQNDLQKGNFINLPDSLLSIKRTERESYYRNYIDENELVDLLKICTYINNSQIIKRVEEIYKDTTYRNNWKDAYACLVANHKEPYTSECLKKCRYNKLQSYNEQRLACEYLWLIQSQQSFKYLSEYLFSNVYDSLIIIDDFHFLNLEADTSEYVIEYSDTIYIDEFIFEDDDVMPYYEVTRTYLYWRVFSIIQMSILNQDFYDMLGITNDRFVSQEFLTEENRRKIYNWMKKNYGKYKIRNRW